MDEVQLTHIFHLRAGEGDPNSFPMQINKLMVDAFGAMRQGWHPATPPDEPVPIFDWDAPDRARIEADLQRIEDWVSDDSKECFPLIHLDYHGNEDGFGSNVVLMTWEELNTRLSRICEAAEGNLLLVMTSCFGASIAEKLFKSMVKPMHFPYFGFISAKGKLRPAHGLQDYGTFYKALFSPNPDDPLDFNAAVHAAFDNAAHPAGYVIDRTQDMYSRLHDNIHKGLSDDSELDVKVAEYVEELEEKKLSPDSVYAQGGGPFWQELMKELDSHGGKLDVSKLDRRAIRALLLDSWFEKLTQRSRLFFGTAYDSAGSPQVEASKMSALERFRAQLDADS